MQLRPWQRMVLQRAWEVDGAGKLCWPVVVTSTARQSGKSWLARAAISARCEHGSTLWNQPQDCLHVANALVAARRIQSQAWRWAEARGVQVRRAFGAERLIWGDDSHWSLVATKSVWGASGSMVFVDEAWDIDQEVIEQGVVPTMLERVNPQLWLVSTANDDATDLMLSYRRDALAGSGRVMLAEWSVPPDADVDDPRVWRRWSAHWSEQRGEFMAAARRRPAFARQYLNQWPDDSGAGERVWPAGWDACGRVSGPVPAGGVGALESTVDRSHYGTAYAHVGGDGRVSVWSARHVELGAACAWLEGRGPVVLAVGASLLGQVVTAVPLQGFGATQSYLATPMLEDLVRRGRVVHDHSPVLSAQSRHARVVQTERGMTLSGKASRGAVETLKAAAWAVLGTQQPAAEAPAIW